MNMTNEELNAAVYQKMEAEQENFIGWLLKMPLEEALEHSFTYTVHQDILMSMEGNVLTNEQAEALLRSDTPLSDVFKEFQKIETGYMDVIRDCIEARANIEIQREQKRLDAQRNLPVYHNTAQYAREHEELDQYRKSRQTNIACKQAIEAAIREHYHDNTLDTAAARQVVDAFGYDRTLYVLAVTVQQKDWDGRISQENKQWAKTIPVPENRIDGGSDRNISLIVGSHTGLMDLFLTEVRRSQVREQSKEKNAEKERPSMLARLKAVNEKPVAKRPPARKGQER